MTNGQYKNCRRCLLEFKSILDFYSCPECITLCPEIPDYIQEEQYRQYIEVMVKEYEKKM